MESILTMPTRTIKKQVTFAKPFRLAGFDSVEPPGTYTLRVEEGQLDSLLFIGWHQIEATLELKHGGRTDYIAIEMQDLWDALLRDSGQSTDPPAAPGTAQKRPVPEIFELRRFHS